MKKFLVFVSLIFVCSICLARTINVAWKVDGNTYASNTCEYGGTLTVPSTQPTKYGYTFQGWAPYTPIEYLESTGTQYIDTGVVFDTGSLKFQALFYIKQIINGENDFIGTLKTGGSSDGFCCGTYQEGTIFLFSRPVNVHLSNIQTGAWYDIIGEFNNNTMSLYVNGSLIDFGTRNSFYSSEHIILFMGGNGYMPLNTYQKLGSVKIWSNNILVRDFIPVLTPDGTPCMYDKVTNRYFYNQGTGQFVAGPVL